MPVHLIYLAEACQIELLLRKANVAHLHAHFGTNSAEVAMLVHTLGGPQWSFTVHGPEEFDIWRLIGLPEKIRRCAFVVVISSYGRSQIYRLIEPSYWHKVHVVRCGIEPAFYSNAVCSLPGRNLVCVGRLCEQKGQLLLIEAVRRLRVQGVKFKLVLAGDGELRSKIEALVAQDGLEDQVRITGWISSRQVRDEILAARALVLPSLAEGLPVVLMEAMSLERPVISTYIAGIPELVNAGEHGWLVPAGDVEALSEAISDCLNAPLDTLAKMGRAAHDRVVARHNIDDQAEGLRALFSAVSRHSA
jgi:glycosyltransferase involved in cell wall biosynthesis